MKKTVLPILVFVLFLSSCNNANSSNDNYSSESINKVKSSESKILNDQTSTDENIYLLSAFGTEPFWNLDIYSKEVYYHDNGNDVEFSYKLLDSYQTGLEYQKLRMLNEDGQKCYLIITKENCDNGMGPSVYPMSVRVEEPDYYFEGCGVKVIGEYDYEADEIIFF